jgi:hypothetical protein
MQRKCIIDGLSFSNSSNIWKKWTTKKKIDGMKLSVKTHNHIRNLHKYYIVATFTRKRTITKQQTPQFYSNDHITGQLDRPFICCWQGGDHSIFKSSVAELNLLHELFTQGQLFRIMPITSWLIICQKDGRSAGGYAVEREKYATLREDSGSALRRPRNAWRDRSRSADLCLFFYFF